MTYIWKLNILVFLCLADSVAGQSVLLPEAPLLQRFIGAGGQDDLFSATCNWKGDIAAVGNSSRGSNGGQDIKFVVFDAQMNTLFERQIGRNNDDGASKIATLPDGRYVLAGFSTQPSGKSKLRVAYKGKRDGWLLVLDEKGELEHELLLGTAKDDVFTCLSVGPDGHIWLAGNSEDHVWLVHLSPQFEVLWERFVQYHQLPTHANAAILLPDGTFYVTGGIKELNQDHLWVAGFSATGTPIMEKAYPHTQAENGTCIVALDQETLAISGTVTDPVNRENCFLSILNRNGVEQQYQAIGGRELDRIHTLLKLSDGTLLAAGGSASFERGSRRISAWISLFDQKGKLLKERYYGSKLNDETYGLMEHPDGRIFAVGTTAQKVLKLRQGWLFQLRPRNETNNAKLANIQATINPASLSKNSINWQKRRINLPFSIENKGKNTLHHLRAVITPADSASRFVLNIPESRSIILHPVSTGTRLDWGLPLKITEKCPPGTYSFNVQFYQQDQVISDALPFSLKIDEKMNPLLDIETPGTVQVEPSPKKKETPSPKSENVKNNEPDNKYNVAIWVYPNPDQFDRKELVWPQEDITVQIKIISKQPINRQQFCIEINGQPCQTGTKFDEVKMKGDQNSKTFTQSIRLTQGENVIQANVQTPDGALKSEPMKIIYSPAKPNLHIVSIGVQAADLKYTVNDARDFALALSAPENKAFEKIFLDTLLAEERTTKTEILKTLRRLQYRYNDLQILPKDLLVIFVSGHGLGAYDGSFRLAASDFDSPYLQETSLDFEQEIVNYVQNLPCKKLFFVDACHSGTTSGTGIAGIATRKNGLNMLVSCQPDEYSYEDDAWRNGAFTHALVRALKSFTTQHKVMDTNADHKLDIAELFAYVRKTVPELVDKKRPKTSTKQHPNFFIAEPGKALVIFE
jgi:Caspase domain